ncbi:uncharacterized protein Dvar_55250 [Desulfosarcina variabilis str. Montpellier]
MATSYSLLEFHFYRWHKFIGFYCRCTRSAGYESGSLISDLRGDTGLFISDFLRNHQCGYTPQLMTIR